MVWCTFAVYRCTGRKIEVQETVRKDFIVCQAFLRPSQSSAHGTCHTLDTPLGVIFICVVANICPQTVVFCSLKAIADRKLCPSGYVARISRRQNTGHIPDIKSAANKRVYTVAYFLQKSPQKTRWSSGSLTSGRIQLGMYAGPDKWTRGPSGQSHDCEAPEMLLANCTVRLRPILCLQRQDAKLASEFLYSWSLLRNNNVAINL